MGTSRMEAFSDGVIAIAITLLVLEVTVRPPGTPLEQFLRGWPSYLAYLVSFVTIGAAWIGHHALTERLDHTDPVLLRLNLLFLLLIGFLPFPTRMVTDSLTEGIDAERVAVVVYGLTLLAIRVAFFAMDAYSAARICLHRGWATRTCKRPAESFASPSSPTYSGSPWVSLLPSSQSSSTSVSPSSWYSRSMPSGERSEEPRPTDSQIPLCAVMRPVFSACTRAS